MNKRYVIWYSLYGMYEYELYHVLQSASIQILEKYSIECCMRSHYGWLLFLYTNRLSINVGVFINICKKNLQRVHLFFCVFLWEKNLYLYRKWVKRERERENESCRDIEWCMNIILYVFGEQPNQKSIYSPVWLDNSRHMRPWQYHM